MQFLRLGQGEKQLDKFPLSGPFRHGPVEVIEGEPFFTTPAFITG